MVAMYWDLFPKREIREKGIDYLSFSERLRGSLGIELIRKGGQGKDWGFERFLERLGERAWVL